MEHKKTKETIYLFSYEVTRILQAVRFNPHVPFPALEMASGYRTALSSAEPDAQQIVLKVQSFYPNISWHIRDTRYDFIASTFHFFTAAGNFSSITVLGICSFPFHFSPSRDPYLSTESSLPVFGTYHFRANPFLLALWCFQIVLFPPLISLTASSVCSRCF